MDEQDRPPPLSDVALQSLREALAPPGAARHGNAAALAAAASAAGGAITIDYSAAATLGQPLVVVRLAPARPTCFAALSAREQEVAALVAQGLRNRDIAARLFISVGTVKDHVHQILEKTGLPSRAAVAAAWRD